MPRNTLPLIAAIATASLATNAYAQRHATLRQLDNAQAKTLLTTSALTQAPAESRYFHRITEMTMSDGVTARVETWAMTPDKILNMVWFPGLGTSQTGFDGTIGWSVSPLMGPVLLAGDHVRVLVGGIRRRPIISKISPASSLDDAALLATGTDQLDGHAVNAFLLVNHADTNRIYMDAETGLLAGYRPLRPAKGRTDTTTLTLLGDYKTIDGVWQPMTTTTRGKGREFVSHIVALDHDPFDSLKFAPPPAVRRLIADKP
ncbi:MAG TPA: hypothetical protein VF483_12575 [Gemmatimonadaceae bacterium]